MAQTFKDVAHSQNMCMTCGRHFGSDGERQQFVAKQARVWGAASMHDAELCAPIRCKDKIS